MDYSLEVAELQQKQEAQDMENQETQVVIMSTSED